MIYDVCIHCNNWHNERNSPPVDIESWDTSKFPPSFLQLVEKIEQYVEDVDRNNAVSASVAGVSESVDLSFASWQRFFSGELSLWKRVRFI